MLRVVPEPSYSGSTVSYNFTVTTNVYESQTRPPQNTPESIFCLASLMKLHIFCQIIPTTSRHNLVWRFFEEHLWK